MDWLPHTSRACCRRSTEGAGGVLAVRNNGKDDPSNGAWEPGSPVTVSYKSASCTVWFHCKNYNLPKIAFSVEERSDLFHLKSVHGESKRKYFVMSFHVFLMMWKTGLNQVFTQCSGYN